MAINHRVIQINLFGEMLAEVLFMKSQAEGFYMSLNRNVSPLGILNRLTYAYSDIPVQYHGNSEYDIWIKEHSHTITGGSTVNINSQNANGASPTGTQITTGTQPDISSRVVQASATKTHYTPKGISTISTYSQSTHFIPLRLEPLDNPEHGYYDRLSGLVKLLIDERPESRVLVLVQNENDAGSESLGLIGNYTANQTPPEITAHSHSFTNLDYTPQTVNGGKGRWVGNQSRETVATNWALSNTQNKFLFPNGKIGFCKEIQIRRTYNTEIGDYIQEKYIDAMESNLNIYDTVADAEELTGRTWTQDDKHSETMFIAVAKKIKECLKMLVLPVGTINDNQASALDSKYALVEKYAVLHVGQLNRNLIDYANEEEYLFQHGECRHRHNVIRKTPGGWEADDKNRNPVNVFNSGTTTFTSTSVEQNMQIQPMQIKTERRGLYVIKGDNDDDIYYREDR